jgi:starch synthase
MGVPVDHREEWAAVWESSLPGSDIPVYFIEHEGFFGREGIYGSKTETDYADNPRRFAFFSRAAFQLCRKLAWFPEILHSHDWPGALVPVYLRHLEACGEFSSTVSVLTIHNLGYQGVYAKDNFGFFGLPWELFHGAGFEFHDAINLLKAGIASADRLTTVSPTYSREIQTSEQGCSLDGLLRARSASLVGILNGVDLDEWNPETDQLLPARYSASDLRGKAACKEAIQREMGLEVDPSVPLFGMVTRLTDQKGVAELFGLTYGCAFSLCNDMDLQFAILGSGEAWCEAELQSLSTRLPNFRARIGYSERLAHLIEAGADFFLMPSRYEPCGLNQMYSLRYGTLPIVRRTGGLADTVSNYDQDTGNGTGFMFDQLSPRAIYDTAGWAVWAWYNRTEHIEAMRTRAMHKVFSWDKAADEYLALYDDALLNVRRP